jgi:hypothetical protein
MDSTELGFRTKVNRICARRISSFDGVGVLWGSPIISLENLPALAWHHPTLQGNNLFCIELKSAGDSQEGREREEFLAVVRPEAAGAT